MMKRTKAHAWMVVVVLAATFAGCGAFHPIPTPMISGSPSRPTASTAPRATLVPTQSPTPSIPTDLPTSVSLRRDGILVTVQLERNPMPAGEPTWVDLEVENIDEDNLTWHHDGCGLPAALDGDLEARWGVGETHTGVGARFKRMTLERRGLDDGSIRVRFIGQAFLDLGSTGCADVGISEQLAPGESRSVRAWWDGMAHQSLGVPPEGPAVLHLWAGYYCRTAESVPVCDDDSIITFDMPAWITRERDPSLLDPPEVVDAALADAAFVSWLGTKSLGNGNEPLLWFDPESNRWHVEVVTYCDDCEGDGTIHGLLIDPRNGAVAGRIDHPWDGRFTHHGW